MRKHGKAALSLLLAAVLLLSTLSVGAFAAETDAEEYGAELADTSAQTLTAPVPAAACGAGGVSVSWKAVEGAPAYRVFVKDGEGWKSLGDTVETSYLDTSAVSDNDYTYTVRCISADGRKYLSGYDDEGASVHYIAAPVLRYTDGTNDGVNIVWQAVEGAYQYRVFYRNRAGGWTRMATTSSTSYLDRDVRTGNTYTYTVRCINENGDYISWFYPEGISCTYLPAPVIEKLEGGADGVDISWGAIPNAQKYRVYYRARNGSWKRMIDTEETSYTDTDVTSGSNYTYTVRCITSDGNDFMSGFVTTGRSLKYVAAPAITKMSNTSAGVNITWESVKGAGKYRIYYYGRSGWTRMATTSATSYLDKDVRTGSNYTYTVRCMNADGTEFVSGFKPGVRHQYLGAPDFSVGWGEKGVKISWPSNGATLYRVYTRSDSGWKRIADTAETSFEDTNVVSGGTYTYTVRCLNADATEFTSDFRAGKSIKYLETPHLSSVTNTASGAELKWNAVKGAVRYRLYTKNEKGGWTRIAETAGTSHVFTAAVSGTTYTYTVRCVSSDGKDFESGFDAAGKTLRYIAAPQKITAVPSANGVRVSWAAPDGAERYRVYTKAASGWKRIGETTESFFEDTNAVSGETYTYTVRCVNAASTDFTSDFDRTGATCAYNDMPVITSVTAEKDGVKISWKPVDQAQRYHVYYYGRNGWARLTHTTDNSVLDTDVSSGRTYRYTVRCFNAEGTQFTSDYNREGVSVLYVAAPKLTHQKATANSISFSWSRSAGAERYRVYKRINGSWNRLLETTANTYTDSNVSLGETYAYTVRCVGSAGEFLSGFDPMGFIITAATNVSDFVYYDQGQYDYPYGDDTIAYSGCGPTCFAMIASNLTGKTVTPVDAVWCGNDYYVDYVGTRWDYFYAAADRFGVKCVDQLGAYEFDDVIKWLKKGKLVISAQGRGIFTRGGHFIVLAGIDADGKIIVFDPNGGNHFVGESFTPDQITDAGTQYWVFDKK